MKLAVVGLGKLGSCLAASLAVAGHDVTGVDSNPDAVEAFATNRPSPEPSLNSYIARAREHLSATTDLGEAMAASTVFVVVPTPSTDHGDFDASAVVDVLDGVTRRYRASGPRMPVVCVVSTTSPGTIDNLSATHPGVRIVYSPLFIALGQIIDDMRLPDFRLIGAYIPGDAAQVRHALDSLSPAANHPDYGVRRPETRTMLPVEAEICKLAVNAYIVTKAAYANTIAMACQTIPGADARRVLDAVGADRRIGHAFLAPGANPGGPCLPRDCRALEVWLDDRHTTRGLPRAAQVVADEQLAYIAQFFAPHHRVAVLGMAYKTGTPIAEASLGKTAVWMLDHKCHYVISHDPAWQLMKPEEAVRLADAVLVATPHVEYVGLDTLGRPTLDMWEIVKPGGNVTVWGKG